MPPRLIIHNSLTKFQGSDPVKVVSGSSVLGARHKGVIPIVGFQLRPYPLFICISLLLLKYGEVELKSRSDATPDMLLNAIMVSRHQSTWQIHKTKRLRSMHRSEYISSSILT
ncbi:hypothetical protein VNO77_02700 [Canavalia gladiata]|uniref:Uncharacterized protein n=1 Tax=Canavalia gladiata TaxID=3824 RepID=A0AAN9MU88_CANGL